MQPIINDQFWVNISEIKLLVVVQMRLTWNVNYQLLGIRSSVMLAVAFENNIASWRMIMQ